MTDSEIGYLLTGVDFTAMTYQGFNMCEDPQDPTTVWVDSLEEWTQAVQEPNYISQGMQIRGNLLPIYAEAKKAAFAGAYSASLADDAEVPLAIAAGDAAKVAFDDAFMDVSNSVYIALSTGNIDRAELLLERAGTSPLADKAVLDSMLAIVRAV